MSDLSDPDEALDVLRREGVRWVGGGRAQPLVDAAAIALAVGHDTPTLRVLAGASKVSAEDEAQELAPDVFDELGLGVHARLSGAAILDLARLLAWECLAGEFSCRTLAVELYWAWANNDYPSELDDWSGLEDWYVMLDDGVIAGSYEEADEAVRRAAVELSSGYAG